MSVVYVNNINHLISLIIEQDQIRRPLVKVGIDGGQGSLKVCVSVVDLENLDRASNSVKDVFIVFIGFNIQENQFNLRKIWLLLKLDEVEFVLCVDLKVANLLCGLKSHSSTYPCCWCVAALTDRQHFDKNAELRTVGGIIQCYKNVQSILLKTENTEDYISDDPMNKDFSEVSNGIDTFSVVSPPIFDRPAESTILSLVAQSSLHFLLGGTNFLLDKLQKHHPNVAQKWLKICGLTRNASFGNSLNGNSCRILLKKAYLLKKISPDVQEFVSLFEAFDRLVNSCFGNSLDQNYLKYLTQFENLFHEANLRETPKLHAIFRHVPQFLCDKPHGLGVYSEQAFEGVHHDFGEHYKNFKRNPNHPEFREKFTRAVITYNARHFTK